MTQPAVELFTPADLAERLDVSVRKVMDWRRENDWPCVNIGRTFRFTPEQFAQIIEFHSKAGTKQPASVVSRGQTSRSAARRSA